MLRLLQIKAKGEQKCETELFKSSVVEEVAVFDISMDDPAAMHVSHSSQQCLHVYTNLTHRHVTYIVLSVHTHKADRE